ncbi:hypothetical protein FB45DRAFT_260156 [Roridomyces roridus]|uniref:C2H2-type domain-containing protein n=1 Tax=Roridomyces roridus TaxID=1738132 RepID=A0AAD7B8D8_9AGAR|nr:hypothetical protein FB45DRAFT_260156 [Roridomyces roridus]
MSSEDIFVEIAVIPATPPNQRRVGYDWTRMASSDDGSPDDGASYSSPYPAGSPTHTGWHVPSQFPTSDPSTSPELMISPFLDSFENMDLSPAEYLYAQHTHVLDDLAQFSPVLLQLPLLDSQAMGSHGVTSLSAAAFDDGPESDILGATRPPQPSALFSSAGLLGRQSVPSVIVADGQAFDLGPRLLPPPCSARVDPSDIARESYTWPDIWSSLGRKRRPSFEDQSPGGRLSFLDSGLSTPDTHSPVSPSTFSFLSAPSPSSSTHEAHTDGQSLPRLVVGSHANAHAARQRRKRPARFQCGRCKATFTARHNLTHHENAHDGIRPYACPRCEGTFTTPGTAARHSKTCKASLRPLYARESSA